MSTREKANVASQISLPEAALAALPDETPKEADVFAEPRKNFPIVGIGASAGGLAAFEAFFSGMPSDAEPGMAFVLVQHLAPDHKSILTELVRRYTRMQVFEVEDGMEVNPNCTYIIPPNRDMALLNGALQLLEPRDPRGHRLPIDFFFRSLAQDQHEQAICIVLSGTGSDGALGVRAVKGEGGMAMAQNPESTEYDSMPRSAIATGLVDYILPPAVMPAQLIAYAAHAFGTTNRPFSPPLPTADDSWKKILVLIRSVTGHDFGQYKATTVNRRVARRMAVHHVEQLEEYVRYLQHDPAEVEALFRDLLIGVTGFFRDPEAFAVLEAKGIPQLFAGKPPGAAIRLWSIGCSTGEEAYSLAILLQEQREKLQQSYQIQVFATDIDRRAIETARAGVYPASIAADVTPARLARFFTEEPDGSAFRIIRSIRDLLIFSEQDVIKDPPFSKLDLISCRNVLIYLNGDLQQKLIPLFHYALKPGGMLFLGTSESVGGHVDLFAPVDHTSKLYQNITEVTGAFRSPLEPRFPPLPVIPPPRAKPPDCGRIPLHELTERALLQRYAGAGVLVTEQGDILYIHGRTGRYLEPAPGEAGTNILKMAREGLSFTLATTLRQAVRSREPATCSGLRVKTNGDFTVVNLTVQPVATGPEVTDPPRFLVILEEAPEAPPELSGVEVAGIPDRDACFTALRQELQLKEEYLQSANEELETANEELKSGNEELQSVNEELQSTNEELETAKEELQSVNEELTTVNAELQHKVADLSRANDDMTNLLAGTGIGTVFVDQHLTIQRFTLPATQVINLILSDVGRPLGHIVSNLAGYDRLIADVQAVLDTLVPREIEVQTHTGAWFLLGIRPYRTVDNVIKGAVLTFTEITELTKARKELLAAEALRRLTVVVREVDDAIIVQDLEGRIQAWNPAAERLFGWSEAEALTMNSSDLTPESEREEALAIVRRLNRAEVVAPYRTRRLAKDGSIVEVALTATTLVNEAGQVYAISTIERKAG